ncbi:RHS repeat domain-containing protein [Nodosilinea nodulosa]|uniref:RHS repeat domain-containing protein n=1 Tax=Nodosilinea nodulosa TaxID=416001 RepID=UPI00030BA63B|nr:RHS repeat-associated core domain-containing protein [Nodosilinea nodulosa]
MKRFLTAFLALIVLSLATLLPMVAFSKPAIAIEVAPPKVLYRVQGSFDLRPSPKEATRSYDRLLAPGDGESNLFEEPFRQASSIVQVSENSYELSQKAKVLDEGGSFLDYFVCTGGDWFWKVGVNDAVDVFLLDGIGKYSVTQEHQARHTVDVSGRVFGTGTNNSSYFQKDGRNQQEYGESSWSYKRVYEGEIQGKCSITFPEYPGAHYCKVANYFAGSGSDFYYPFCYGSDVRGSVLTESKVVVQVSFQSREPEPGAEDCLEAPDRRTGNYKYNWPDPIATRGYPLRNDIHLNTQVVESDRPMGNATFSYDIHLRNETWRDRTQHLLLIDGDGSRLDYGDPGGSLAPPTDAYGQLIKVGEKYELRNAGAPDNVERAGNFTYRFGKSGNLQKIVDPAGNEQVLNYTNNQLSNVADTNTKRQVQFSWQGNKIVEVNENGGGAITRLSYTPQGLLAKIDARNSDGSRASVIGFSYDARGLLTAIVEDENPDSTLSFSYDIGRSNNLDIDVPLANITTRTKTTGLRYNQTASDGYARRTIQTNAKGGTTFFDFTAKGDVGRIITPSFAGAGEPSVFTLEYDNKHNPTRISDGATTTIFTYNDLGLITEVSQGGAFQRFTYQGVNPLRIEDNRGILFQYAYENAAFPHNPTKITDGSGASWQFTYNKFGQVTEVRPPNGSAQGVTRIDYNERGTFLGLPRRVTDGSGKATLFDSYSKLGDLLIWRDTTESPTVSSKIDALHREIARTFGDGSSYQRLYQGQDLDQTIDELGTRYAYEFCKACGGLKRISGPLGWSLSFLRDSDDDVTKFIDARGNETRYGFGSARELARMIYPDGSEETYAYDKAGRIRSVTNSRGQVTAYTYDALGQVKTINRPEGTTTFRYAADGLVESVTDLTGTTRYGYDASRRITSLTYDYTTSGLTIPQVLEAKYFPDGLLQELIWKSGNAIAASWLYQYDGAGRLTRVTNNFNESTRFKYDSKKRLSEQKNQNKTVTTYTYDPQRSWLSSIIHQLPGGEAAQPLSFSMQRDKTGKITEVQSPGSSSIRYQYDELYRVTREEGPAGTRSYGYDLAGNLTTLDGQPFAVYDAANKISNLAGATVAYDADGNLTQLQDEQFVWDSKSKLIQRTIENQVIRYGYNEDGLRISREEGNQKRFFVFFGDLLLGEVTKEGVPQRIYTWGANGLVSLRHLPEKQSYWVGSGPRAESAMVTDRRGKVVAAYQYEAYGKITKETESIGNPFKFVGQFGCYTDQQIMLCGQRWYETEVKRWLSRDPLGYEGSKNLYSYVDANPISFFDDLGDEPRDPNKYLKPGTFAQDSIPAPDTSRDFTTEQRRQINEIGRKSGCHTCGSKTPGTKQGSFIPDHQPPSQVYDPARHGPQRLYPQCLNCSRIQGGYVRQIIKRGSGLFGILGCILSSDNIFDEVEQIMQQARCAQNPKICEVI